MIQFLVAIVVINSFVLLLCALLNLTGRLLRQSGQVKLEVNNSAKEVDCGQTLLACLAQRDIYLPAACGGKGTCGRCEVKVRQGGGAISALERLQLSDKHLLAMARLACQVKVREDVRVEVSEHLLSARSYKVKLNRIENQTPEIKTLHFLLEAEQQICFFPGQYLQVTFNQPWERLLRAYSISSSPLLKNAFSFDVQRIEGGLVSNWLHALKLGDLIDVAGPFGEMALREEHLGKPLILIAGGVGLAPLRAMLAQLESSGFAMPVILFHGARSRKNLYCEEQFRLLAKKFKQFTYVPALSKPMLEDGWTENRAMIHQVLDANFPKVNPSEAIAFVCGPALMMQEVLKVLVAKGLTSDKIFADPFDF